MAAITVTRVVFFTVPWWATLTIMLSALVLSIVIALIIIKLTKERDP